MKTKQLIKYFSPLIALGLTGSVALASDTFAEGDLLVGFYEITGTNPGVVSDDTLVLNLGPAHLYRANTQNNVAVKTINAALPSSNINADLTAAFGDWANDATSSVYWFVIGGVTQSGTLTNGDPTRTTYYSKARSNVTATSSGPGSASGIPATLGEFETPSLSLSFSGFTAGTNDAINGVNGGTSTSGLNTALAIIPIGNVNSMEDYLPPGQSEPFGIGENPRQRLTTGAIAGGTLVEGALNVFRYLDHGANLTGAVLTSGASTGNAVVGVPQFIGTLTLAANGDLKITAIPSANPDSDNDGMLDSWETTYFGSLSQGANDDFDKDGTKNIIEHRLNLIPNSGTSFFAATRNANSGQLSWPSVTGVSFKVFRSTTLAPGSWTDIQTVPGTAGTATYTDPSPPVGKAFYFILLQP